MLYAYTFKIIVSYLVWNGINVMTMWRWSIKWVVQYYQINDNLITHLARTVINLSNCETNFYSHVFF